MRKVLGLILLVAGCATLYPGWQAHEGALATAEGDPAVAAGSESVWLVTAIVILCGFEISLRYRPSRLNILSVFQPKIPQL